MDVLKAKFQWRVTEKHLRREFAVQDNKPKGMLDLTLNDCGLIGKVYVFFLVSA